jgi:uncharacterized protein (DUF1800 family)
LHEPRSKTVLGIRYQGEPWDDPRPSGVEQGYEAIRDLCAHPSTARFVATKLVRHFVSDDPPPLAIQRIAALFTDSGGDLRAVAEALIDVDEAWHPEHRRTPQDWLVAALRSVHAPEAPPRASRFLRQLRHGLWEPAGPNGYGDGEPEWADPDSLMNRAELATTLTGRLGLENSERPQALRRAKTPWRPRKPNRTVCCACATGTATTNGYGLMAEAFAAVLEKLDES